MEEDLTNWKNVKAMYNKNYTLMYEHYERAEMHSKDGDYPFLREWYAARAYKMMVGEANYHDFSVKYLELFDKYPYHAEPVYELCQSAPLLHQRYDLYKKCLECTFEVEKNGVLEWKALCGLLVECHNLQKYDEAYEVWKNISRECVLEKIHSKYKEWVQYIIQCGNFVTEKMKAKSSYHLFRCELDSIKREGSIHDIHIVWVKGYRQYSIIQYLCVRASHELKHPTSNIYIYNDVEPDSDDSKFWWDKTKEYATIVKVTPPRFINGVDVPHPQHVADIMRVCIIYRFGGTYLDSDLLLTKSLSPLIRRLEHHHSPFGNVMMCKETDNKIWNGFIMAANPHNPFLRRWIREYETKYGNPEGGCWWAGLSVETPMRLFKSDSTDVILIDTCKFLPFGFHDDKIYQGSPLIADPYPLSYGVHLWETEAEKRGVLPKNREWFIDNPNTIFTHLFGKYVSEEA